MGGFPVNVSWTFSSEGEAYTQASPDVESAIGNTDLRLYIQAKIDRGTLKLIIQAEHSINTKECSAVIMISFISSVPETEMRTRTYIPKKSRGSGHRSVKFI
jgi:hypothetical protein